MLSSSFFSCSGRVTSDLVSSEHAIDKVKIAKTFRISWRLRSILFSTYLKGGQVRSIGG